MTEPGNLAERETDAQGYRAISKLALLTGLLGVASSSAVFFRTAWLIPCLTVVVGIVALRQIRYYAPDLAGRRLALVGIAAAILLGMAGLSRHATHVFLVRREAQVVANGWF